MLNPLILTLEIDAVSFRLFDDLRKKYFPPERNFLAAHVTLFHHLPGESLENIRHELTNICAETETFPLVFSRWRFLGKGSAMNIESPELLNLRARLTKLWNVDLTAQDKNKFQPHITVQNKVSPVEAKLLYENLSAVWEPQNGTAEGLLLWQYVAPRWKFEQKFSFL